MKQILLKRGLITIISTTPLVAIAQGTGSGNSNFYSELLASLLTGAAAIVVIGSLVAIYRLFSLMIKMREIEIYEKHGLTELIEEKKASDIPSWKRIYRKMSGMVPIEKERDILMDHNYDGIRELDNDLPPWWLYGFYLTIAIAIFYIGFYHFSPYAQSSADAYEEEMEIAQASIDDYLSKQADQIDENSVVSLTDEASLADGQNVFKTLCAVCHLEHGGGGPGSVGPNLTDEYWLHGGSIVDVFKTIKYGVPEKGMISWKSQLRPAEMHKVASYIMSIQGTNPPGAKEPQGELYVAADETGNNSAEVESE
jgi:cytochrome c oxidase cbb3-type subunit 3